MARRVRRKGYLVRRRGARASAYIRAFQGKGKHWRGEYDTIGTGNWSYSIRMGNRTFSYYGYPTRAAAIHGGRQHAIQKGMRPVVAVASKARRRRNPLDTVVSDGIVSAIGLVVMAGALYGVGKIGG